MGHGADRARSDMIRENKLENDWDCLGLNRVRSCKCYGRGFMRRDRSLLAEARLNWRRKGYTHGRGPFAHSRAQNRSIGVRQPLFQLPAMLSTLRDSQPQGGGYGLEGFCKREGPMMKETVEPLQEQKLREAVRTTASANQRRPATNEGVNARVRDSR